MFGINHLGKINLVRIIGKFEKSGVKLQCLTGKGRLSLVRIMGNFQKTEDSRNRDSIVIHCTIVPYLMMFISNRHSSTNKELFPCNMCNMSNLATLYLNHWELFCPEL